MRVTSQDDGDNIALLYNHRHRSKDVLLMLPPPLRPSPWTSPEHTRPTIKAIMQENMASSCRRHPNSHIQVKRSLGKLLSALGGSTWASSVIWGEED